VNWNFLKQALRLKDFNPTWCDWIRAFCGNVGFKVIVRKWATTSKPRKDLGKR
jgi:hypothetical protein